MERHGKGGRIVLGGVRGRGAAGVGGGEAGGVRGGGGGHVEAGGEPTPEVDGLGPGGAFAEGGDTDLGGQHAGDRQHRGQGLQDRAAEHQ
jgi:hypothetical protein